jgi:hypothetical protein
MMMEDRKDRYRLIPETKAIDLTLCKRFQAHWQKQIVSALAPSIVPIGRAFSVLRFKVQVSSFKVQSSNFQG